ncbi:MAG: ABC transporter permease subunit [Ruminococcaceae bacterium]|nr:ABC transporter permease subunit [Oscillospiraceae bacterium]
MVLIFWLGVWQVLALIVAKPLLLPAPPAVLGRIAQLIISAEFWYITAVSLGRILLGVVCAMALGVLLALATSRWALLRSLFSPLLTVIKSTPVASFIILLILWVGRDILPSVIVVLMALPIVWSNVSTGISQTDPLLIEMARVYRFSPWRRLRRVYIPSVMPHFLAACRSCLGLAWKAGVAAEVLTVPALSIGKILYESKLYWETLDLFAWTVVVIICSLIIEKVLIAAIAAISKSYSVGGGKS